MTFARGQFNPNPLANPFNTLLGKCSISTCKNPKDLQVPNQDVPLYGTPEWEMRYGNSQKRLEVPNQDIPFGDQLRGNGFIGNSDRLFRLADGTLLDFKTRKVISQPTASNSQYWGNPSQDIDYSDYGMWNDSCEPKLEDLINRIDDYYGRTAPNIDCNLDQKSIDYWIRAEEEADALRSSMTDAQKEMIADFEHHFPKSRLIEESKKASKIFLKRNV